MIRIEPLEFTREKLHRRSILLEQCGTVCAVVSWLSAGLVIYSILNNQTNNRNIGLVIHNSALVTFITTRIINKKNDEKLAELNKDN